MWISLNFHLQLASDLHSCLQAIASPLQKSQTQKANSPLTVLTSLRGIPASLPHVHRRESHSLSLIGFRH